MCELLCDFIGQGNPGAAFIVGLFSTLDAMLNALPRELLDNLPVVGDVKLALLDAQGVYGYYLDVVLAHEKADWARVDSDRLTQSSVSDLYVQSIQWADHTVQFLGSG